MLAHVPERAARWLPLLAGAWLSGCATYSDSFTPIESQLVAGRFDRALAAHDAQPHPERDAVLAKLNQGMLRRMAGRLDGSNESLEAAKQQMEQLYGTSLSETAASFIVNDGTRSYAGEEYEQVLVHLYKAFNYLEMGKRNEARVEALQVDIRLRELASRIPDYKYREDPLARYLSGMLFEDLGEWSDALIAYRKAHEAFRAGKKFTGIDTPRTLQNDLLRLTERQGLTDEMRKYQREFGIERWTSAREASGLGEVVFILHNGLVPILRERSNSIMDPTSGKLIRLSLPYYESRPTAAAYAEISVGEYRALAGPVENVAAIARANLDAKLPAITARAVARQVVKQKLAKEVTSAATKGSNRNNGSDALLGAFIGMGTQVAAYATERADTRSWVTLPHNIMLGRLTLPPGRHNVKVELYGAQRNVLARFDFPAVDVQAGRKAYLSRHWIPSAEYSPRRFSR
jgi:hypothetical protein